LFCYTFASIDSKEVVWPGMLQNAVRFVSIANEALRPDWRAPEIKNAGTDAGATGSRHNVT
jgi:hypothetical protein